MSSENAKNVAEDVIECMDNGDKIVFKEIMESRGYTKATAKNPKNVKETKSYQLVIKPVISQMEEERQAVINRLKTTRNKAKYRDLMDALDKLTKNIQLLSGVPTDITKNKEYEGFAQEIRSLIEE